MWIMWGWMWMAGGELRTGILESPHQDWKSESVGHFLENIGMEQCSKPVGSGRFSEPPRAHPRFPLWLSCPEASVAGPGPLWPPVVPCGPRPPVWLQFRSALVHGMWTKKRPRSVVCFKTQHKTYGSYNEHHIFLLDAGRKRVFFPLSNSERF